MNENILVVDDDELVRSGLAMNLERAGFTVREAACSEDVNRALGEQPADLVLCDLVLGDENGMDILRSLQARHPDISVVILTGHGSVRNALEALKSGASDYIQKPADPEEVIHRIRMVLDSVTLKRSLLDERQRTEERKKVMHEQLIRAERMSSLGMLAGGAASDLKEILSPVERIYEELQERMSGQQDVTTRLEEMADALRKASSVIRDLEIIGKSNSLEKANVQLNEVINEYLRSAELRQLAAVHAKVKFVPELDPELLAVLGSPAHLRQVVANLIGNALESMAGSGLLRIRTRLVTLEGGVGRLGAMKSGEFALLQLEDTAARLSDEDIERMFEPFYIRSRLGRRLLSGLGLTLVYRVVEDHGGFLDIRSDGPVGNVISVYLPVSTESDSAILELRPDYTGGEKILLVDDSEIQRQQASDMMQEMGYRVTTAANGFEALEILQQHAHEAGGKPPFDLMVIDLVLGDAFDGVETFKKVVEMAPGQKAILASGFADITRIVEARKLGISQCFQKPYTPENLGKHIRLALDEG